MLCSLCLTKKSPFPVYMIIHWRKGKTMPLALCKKDEKSWFCHWLTLKLRLGDLITHSPNVSLMKVTNNSLHPIFWDSAVFIRTKGMVNTFNSEFVIHITHMKAETKATCVPTFHLSNSSMLWGQSLQHKRIWSNICRHEITSVVQRRVWFFFF